MRKILWKDLLLSALWAHVDHGKTSILDAIRKTSVTSGRPAALPSTSAPMW